MEPMGTHVTKVAKRSWQGFWVPGFCVVNVSAWGFLQGFETKPASWWLLSHCPPGCEGFCFQLREIFYGGILQPRTLKAKNTLGPRL